MSSERPEYYDENMEEEEELVEIGQGQEDEEGEDLFDEQNLMRDYRRISALDTYEEGEQEVEQLVGGYEEEQQARRQAERYMAQRDQGAGLHLDGDNSEQAVSVLDEMETECIDNEDKEPGIDGGRVGRGRLLDWFAQETVRKDIHTKFTKFLHNFMDESGKRIYIEKLETLVRGNKCSLEVDLLHLSRNMLKIAAWVLDHPKIILDIFADAAKEYVTDKYDYNQYVCDKIFVRLTNINVSYSIRDLRTDMLNCMVTVEGVVTRRTNVYPQLSVVKFNCLKCGYILGPFQQNGDKLVEPKICSNCNAKAPFEVNTQKTLYRNYQKINLQESPGKVPPGRLPRSKEVILLYDLIDIVRPGEEVSVVGIYQHNMDLKLNVQSGFPLLHTYIEANNIIKQQEQFSWKHITEEDKERIRDIASRPNVGEVIANSIAPSIFGHQHIKECLSLALFGGEEKYHHTTSGAQHRIRGDINMLILGDPGTAKSQFLKYVEKTAGRVVNTTGKGASAVGLTAAVHKDPVTKEWTLEGGALVLADKGICLIDEFDKMNEHDRVSIHEAMEQQSISISKAGIVTQLQARCCVIAAANPTLGRYVSSRTFAENVQLSDPILSRFDILCVVKDVIDPLIDEQLASFVVSNHAGADEEVQSNTRGIDQDLLKKYIAYAKQNCHPKWASDRDSDKIVEVYSQLRDVSSFSHAMPMTVRHLEGMVRLAEANAKMHLRSLVQDEDISVAIKLMLRSFISTQKLSVQKRLEKRFGAYLNSYQDQHQLLLHVLKQLLRRCLHTHESNQEISIPCRKLEQEAQSYGVSDYDSFYHSQLLQTAGFCYDRDGQRIVYLQQ